MIAKYSHSADGPTARLYTDEVYRIIGTGVRTAGVTTAPQKVTPELGAYARVAPLGTRTKASIQAVDYPGAIWNAACTCNYRVGRTQAISTIVIHVTQESYAGTISWFKDPAAQVSAHYVIRSSDGQVTQMVAEKDTAWHVRTENPYTIGIEHEGFVDQPSWFTGPLGAEADRVDRHRAARPDPGVRHLSGAGRPGHRRGHHEQLVGQAPRPGRLHDQHLHRRPQRQAPRRTRVLDQERWSLLYRREAGLSRRIESC